MYFGHLLGLLDSRKMMLWSFLVFKYAALYLWIADSAVLKCDVLRLLCQAPSFWSKAFFANEGGPVTVTSHFWRWQCREKYRLQESGFVDLKNKSIVFSYAVLVGPDFVQTSFKLSFLQKWIVIPTIQKQSLNHYEFQRYRRTTNLSFFSKLLEKRLYPDNKPPNWKRSATKTTIGVYRPNYTAITAVNRVFDGMLCVTDQL